ncbi:hypothetical protein HKD37_06G016153 [Glycine soja]
MGEGCCTQPYPCICKETVSGFEPMTNKSPRHNFTAAPGLALHLSKSGIITKSISIPKPQESPHFRVIHWPHYATAPRALGISTRNHSAYNQECPFL